VWSPDGRFCATLEPSSESEEGRVVIYPASGTVGETVPLPYVQPKRLLGWSPDERLLMVLGDMDFPVAVGAMPMAERIRLMMEAAGQRSEERVTICGYPIDAAAGPPSWSSGCDMLAYVTAARLDDRLGGPADAGPPNASLVATAARRHHIDPIPPSQVESQLVLSNMKQVALALQMYLADNNDVFPPSEGSEEAWWILDEYVRDRSLFMRPGTEDDMVVEYLVPPGIRLVEVDDIVTMPVAVVDYHPDFYVLAYGDGHVMMHPKHGEYWEEWEGWWREFWEKRAEQMGQSGQ